MHKNEENTQEDLRRFRARVFVTTALLNIVAILLLLFMYLVAGLQSFTDDKSDQIAAIEGLLFVLNPFLGFEINGEKMTQGEGALIVLVWALVVGFVLSRFLTAIRRIGRAGENEAARSKMNPD